MNTNVTMEESKRHKPVELAYYQTEKLGAVRCLLRQGPHPTNPDATPDWGWYKVQAMTGDKSYSYMHADELVDRVEAEEEWLPEWMQSYNRRTGVTAAMQREKRPLDNSPLFSKRKK